MLGFSGQLKDKIDALTSELESLNKRYYDTVQISDYALWEYDISSKTMYLTKKLFGKFSEMNKEIVNYREKMLEWKLVHPEDVPIFEQYCDSMDSGDSKFVYEYRQILDEDIFRWLRTEGTTVFDNVGNPKRVIGRTIDISIEKVNDEKLIERANTDFLTKINTKKYTYDLINSVTANSNGVKCAFLLIDVDDFKYINDSFGHSFGDSVLLRAATILTANVNSSNDIVGRLGGDEFCVFLYDIKSDNDILEYYQRVKNSLVHIDLGSNDHLRISVGAVVYPTLASNLEEMLANADMALYQTKFNNKDSITIFNSSMHMPDMNKSNSHSRGIESLSAIENIEVSQSNSFDPVKVKDDLINSYEAFRDLSIAYYIITEDYKIKYCSPNLKEVFPSCNKVILGSNCYETIRNMPEPCSDCPLRNGQNSNIHYTCNYIGSQMNYNVTYHRFNNSNGILVCWNDLTDFSRVSSFVNDYLTKMMIYSTFIIETNKRIHVGDNNYKMVYLSIDDFRNLSKSNDLHLAIDLFVAFGEYLKTSINEEELVTITTPYEFYALLKNDANVDARINDFVINAEQMLKEKFNLDVLIKCGIETINENDNNAHLIAINAKKNSGGTSNG